MGYTDYVEFHVLPDSLLITLTAQGKEYITEVYEQNKEYAEKNPKWMTGDISLFSDLTESICYNSNWDFIPSMDRAGDLLSKDCLVLSEEWQYDDEEKDTGRIIRCGYYYPDYALNLYCDVLLEQGSITFQRHDYLTAQEYRYELASKRPDLFDEFEVPGILAESENYYAFKVSAANGQLTLNMEAA